NGAWRLRVADGGPQDIGTLQCWTLSLFPTICTEGLGPCAADVAVSATASPSPAFSGVDLTYNVIVTNNRAIAATGVVLTDVVPPNTTFVSATASQGGCTLNGGTVLCNVGTLGGNSAA